MYPNNLGHFYTQKRDSGHAYPRVMHDSFWRNREAQMRFTRVVIALILSILATFAVGMTAFADPPGMTHDGKEMTHD